MNPQVSDWGKNAFAVAPGKWKHSETTHFILHFFRDGEKIGRRSESFYEEIRQFFGNRKDLLEGRKSQVFAFREADDWAKFVRSTHFPGAVGITHGDEFFYLSTGDDGRFDSKGKVQAHEMTHLVFNRFFDGHVPLWLNEGIAEYFGQRKTTSLVDFRRQMGQAPRFSLEKLLSADTYPGNPLHIQAFYAEAAIIVDFLTKSEDRRALLPKFVDAIIAENNMGKAVTIYGYRNLNEFEDAYSRYRRRF